MAQSLRKRKVWLVLLSFSLLFVFGCSSACRQWQYDDVCTPCGLYNSGRMILPVCIPGNNLELEIRRGLSGTHVYVNVCSLPVPPASDDNSIAPVTVSVGDSITKTFAERLQGGQRLILPCEISQDIINGLLNNECIVISAGAYQAEIINTGFHKHYERLNRIKIPISSDQDY